MRQPRLLRIAALTIAVTSLATPLLALEARVVRVRSSGTRLWAAIEIRDLLRDNFLVLIRQGRAVFLQVAADLWEERRVFDRIVTTTPATTWRLEQNAGESSIVVQDQFGGTVGQADIRQAVTLRIDLGPANRLDDGSTYYVHATVTAATVDERDIEQAGAAIFGEEGSARGLADVGRFVFRTLLRMGKYFETASTDVTSRRVSGRDIRLGAF